MNEEARAELDRIIALEPAALTDSDRAFLQARRSYLTEEQKAVHAEALGEQPASVEAPAENGEADDQPRARMGRRAVEQPGA